MQQKTTLYVVTIPYGLGSFPKKAKIRNFGGAGFRQPSQGRFQGLS